MFQRKFVITDSYREEISKFLIWDETTIETNLISHVKYVDKIITDIYRLKKDLSRCEKDYTKLYIDKYNYYSYDSKLVPETEQEKKNMINDDADIIDMKTKKAEIENDIEFLMNFKDGLRDKSYNIKQLIEYRKFMAGA